MRWCFRSFRIGCPKPTPVYVPVASCTHGVVIQRGSQGEIDGIAALGVKVCRMTYYTAQETEATYRQAFEARLLALDAKGIETLIVVHDFAARDQVASQMGVLVQAFPGRVWQVGNEWDAQPWKGWGTTGTDYAALMQSVVASCPSARFVGMGLASADGEPLGVAADAVRQPTFLTDYVMAGGPALEAWCLHLYGDIGQAMIRVTATQRVLDNRFPLWVTEYNARGRPVSDATAVQVVTDMTASAARLGVSRAYVYDYWDGPGTAGLVREDDTHRPAWDTLHTVLSSR